MVKKKSITVAETVSGSLQVLVAVGQLVFFHFFLQIYNINYDFAQGEENVRILSSV